MYRLLHSKAFRYKTRQKKKKTICLNEIVFLKKYYYYVEFLFPNCFKLAANLMNTINLFFHFG